MTVVDAHYQILDEDSKSPCAIYYRNSIFKGMLQDVVTMPAAKRIVALDKICKELPEESQAGFVLYTHKIDPRYKFFAAGHYTVGNALTVSPALLPFGIEGKSIALAIPVVCAGLGRCIFRTDSRPAINFAGGYDDSDKAGYSALSMEYADWLLAKDETTSPSRGRSLLAGCANGTMHNGVSAVVRLGSSLVLFAAAASCAGIFSLASFALDKLPTRNNKKMDARFISQKRSRFDFLSAWLETVANKTDQCVIEIWSNYGEKILGRLNPSFADTFSKAEGVLTDRARERAAKQSPKAPALQA